MLTLWKSCQSREPIWSLRCFFTGAERPLSLSSSFLSFCPPIMQEEEAEGSLVLTPGILALFWWSSRHRCSGRNAPRPGPQTEIKPETFLPSSHCALLDRYMTLITSALLVFFQEFHLIMKASIPKFLLVLYLIQTDDERLIKNVSQNSPLFTEKALSGSHITHFTSFIFSPVSFRL